MDDTLWWKGFNQFIASLAVLLGFLAYFWHLRRSKKQAAAKLLEARSLALPEGRFASFLQECLQRDDAHEPLAWDTIFAAYMRWCELRHLRPMLNLNNELATFCETQGIARKNKGRRMFCVGVRLVEPQPSQAH
jgi:hypothetical protein